MSFIQIKNGVPNFNVMTMEIWFRVPKAMMKAAAEETKIEGDGPRIMQNILPLFMYGEMLEKPFPAPQYALVSNGTPGDGAPAWTALTGFTDGDKEEFDPCYIGVDCRPRFFEGKTENVKDVLKNGGRLVFNIQTSAHATGSGLYADLTSVTNVIIVGDLEGAIPPAYIGAGGNGSGKYSFIGFDFNTDPDNPPSRIGYGDAVGYTDSTSGYLSRTPEYFYVEVHERIKPDKWYHLILSFDISGTFTAQTPDPTGYLAHEKMWENAAGGISGSYGKMWYALNDVDYRGRGPNKPPDQAGRVFPYYHMGPYSHDYINAENINPFASSPPNYSGPKKGDPNGILTKTAFDVASQVAPSFNNPWNLPAPPKPTVTVEPGMIETIGTPLGFPAIEDYVDHIYQVEMARFRVWYGKTFDTKKESERRLFITDEGKPAKLSLAVDAFERKPDISLERSIHWIKGLNTGSLGYDDKGKKDPDGQFDVNGKKDNPNKKLIKRYSPQPSLYGPQKPGEKVP